MSDRELLEKAAKAAGVAGEYESWTSQGFAEGIRQVLNGTKCHKPWNPLTDDGDALRLAVRLRLHVGINPGNTVFCVPTYSDKPSIRESCERNGAQDEYAATRRAIVRAAAAIGESK